MSDGMYDAYLDLAAESGYSACAECHQWRPREELVEVDCYYYCPECAPLPDINEIASAICERVPWADPKDVQDWLINGDAQNLSLADVPSLVKEWKEFIGEA